MSNLLSELQKGKSLKKTATKEQTTNLNEEIKRDQQQKQDMNFIHDKIRNTDLEMWYDKIKDLTYETKFLPISLQEGKAMHHFYESKGTLSPSQPETLNQLEQKLQQAIEEYSKHGVFVKLSSRSPKDASVASQKTIKIFEELLEKSPNNDNAKLIAINRAHILALKMDSAKEILTTMLSSERVYEDLSLALDYPAQWNQHFVIRKFVPIPIEYEFRGFVLNKKFKCMCQYYHYIYFPHLVQQKKEIEKTILEFWEKNKDRIPLDTYVVDFALDTENKRVCIIELNPFGDYEGMGTSTSMFDKVKDRAILFGDAPWEFRVELEPPTDIFKIMGDKWKAIMKNYTTHHT